MAKLKEAQTLVEELKKEAAVQEKELAEKQVCWSSFHDTRCTPFIIGGKHNHRTVFTLCPYI